MKIRRGIFIAANIAHDELAPALRRSKRAELAAVASISFNKAKRFKAPVIYDFGSNGVIPVDSSFRPDLSDDQFGKVTVRDDNGNVILFERFKDDQYLNQVEHIQGCIHEGKRLIIMRNNRLRWPVIRKKAISHYKATL